MLKVNSTEVQNNFGKYLLLSLEQDVIITRNGQEVARLSGLRLGGSAAGLVSEEVLAGGYGIRQATYEEFIELTKDSDKRYEFIDGEIFLQASPKVDHQSALTELLVIMYQHFSGKPCSVFAAPFDIRISRHEKDINVVQPDLMVICDLAEKMGADGYYHGVPDLVVEILSEGTHRNDLIKKLNLYLDGGVQEYWTVDPKTKQIIIYSFQDCDIASQVSFKIPENAFSFLFPELKIDLKAVFRPI